MYLSTVEAGRELGLTDRQVRRAIAGGRLGAKKIGGRYVVPERQVYALKRMRTHGRAWSENTQRAALDLLSNRNVQTVQGSQLSRLRSRVRTCSIDVLASQLLFGKVSLHRGTADQIRELESRLAPEIGLSGIGLGVIVADEAKSVALQKRLHLDDEGNVVAIHGEDAHAQALEALALHTYGGVREREASRSWLESKKAAL